MNPTAMPPLQTYRTDRKSAQIKASSGAQSTPRASATSWWVTLPSTMFALEIADKGWRQAMRDNPKIRRGANIVDGKVTHQEVADALGVDWAPLDALI